MQRCADSGEEQHFIASVTSYMNSQSFVAYEESVGAHDVERHMQAICRYTCRMNGHTVDSLFS